MRLPRAEDEAVLFVAVDGEALRVDGVVQRVTLHAAAGINMLTGQMLRDHVRTHGEITITLRSMQHVTEIEEPEVVTVRGPDGAVETFVVMEGRRALPD